MPLLANPHEHTIDMKILSAYSLEQENLSTEDLSRISSSIEFLINKWLEDKGAIDVIAPEGTFISQTKNGDGRFSRRNIAVREHILSQVETKEKSKGGQIFSTHISVVKSTNSIRIYGLLSVSNESTIISPAKIDPRCPGIIRDILTKDVNWKIGSTTASTGKSKQIIGSERGEKLANFIESSNRTIPVIVISEYDGEPIWKNVAKHIAYDLIGIAYVCIIDNDASIEVARVLGQKYSCNNGAIRIYWPNARSTSIPSQKWTASKLLTKNDDDGQNFRSFIRHKIMEVASLTTVPHQIIWEIESEATREKIRKLQDDASLQEVYFNQALEYENKITQLSNERRALQDKLQEESSRADIAEENLSALTRQFEDLSKLIAKAQKDANENPVADGIDTGEEDSDDDEIPRPQSGDTWFLKKTHTKDTYDVLVKINDCHHTSWQNSSKADKAKKGIERLVGHRNWKHVHHCGTCTGGGVWRVKW